MSNQRHRCSTRCCRPMSSINSPRVGVVSFSGEGGARRGPHQLAHRAQRQAGVGHRSRCRCTGEGLRGLRLRIERTHTTESADAHVCLGQRQLDRPHAFSFGAWRRALARDGVGVFGARSRVCEEGHRGARAPGAAWSPMRQRGDCIPGSVISGARHEWPRMPFFPTRTERVDHSPHRHFVCCGPHLMRGDGAAEYFQHLYMGLGRAQKVGYVAAPGFCTATQWSVSRCRWAIFMPSFSEKVACPDGNTAAI